MALLLAFLFSQPLEAQVPAKRRGVALSRQALSLFKAKRYKEAIARFQESEAIFSHKSNWYFIGESHRRLGERQKSLEAYTRYAALLGEDERARFLPKLEFLRWESPCALSLSTRPGGAAVLVDDRPQGKTPEDGSPLELALAGGRHRLQVQRPGHRSVSQEVLAELGEPVVLSLILEPLPATRPARKSAAVARPPARSTARSPSRPLARPRTATKSRPSSGGLFAALFAGPALTDYGDDRLEVGLAVEMGVDVGYSWRLGRLGLHVHGCVLHAPIRDEASQSSMEMLLLLGGVGGQVFFSSRIWADLRIGIGASVLLGADEKSFFFAGATEVQGAFATFALRPSFSLGFRVWRGLTLMLYPFALDYSPRHEEYNQNITRILRYHWAMGLAWQG